MRAALVHLIATVCVAVLAAVLVFGVWFPYPYRELAGGRDLFLLIVMVDVVCGPLLTMVLYNPKKPRWELFVDLGLVVLIQLAALAYGVHTLAAARPVYLVFEVDRFRVVSAADVWRDELRPEQGGLHRLPWTGPQVIATREPKDADERLSSLDLSLQGVEPSVRPDWWIAYEDAVPAVLARAQTLQALKERQPQSADLIAATVRQSGLSEEGLRWLPLTGFKSTSWVVFVDGERGAVRGFAPIDGF